MVGPCVISVVFVLLTFGCGAAFSDIALNGSETRDHVKQQRRVHRENSTASRLEREFGFIKRTERTRSRESPGAIGGGTLVVDRVDCLRFEENGDLPVWPYEYSLIRRGDDLVILNGKSQIEARVGDKVEVGGGQITKAESGGGYEEKRRELGIPDRCRGALWYISPGVRVIETN